MNTVISAFEDRAAAQRAIDRLAAAGFARNGIHLHQAGEGRSGEEGRTGGGDDSPGDFGQDNRGVLESIGHFFVSVFGHDTPALDNAEHYSEAARRGHPLVAVDTASEEMTERAAIVLEQEGPIDLEERAALWLGPGWTHPTDRPTPPAGVQTTAAARHRGVHVVRREPIGPPEQLLQPGDEQTPPRGRR